ncbi:UvrD-helicase domain-containing protein [Escherichia coli]|uniref:UvrD-helicase domain-containing protein n=1 Tax=Escherichia coli TaxID=562 RepID=UPI000B7D4B54|nr:ATP-dependent helicase [Escherichia coli]
MDDQKRQLINIKDNLLVSACPGAGKTKLLIGMLEDNLYRNESFRWHIVLTHTNAAADEISSRIDNLSIEVDRVWCGTIHSFFLEWVVKKYAGAISRLKDGFSLLSEYKQKKIIKSIESDKKLGVRIRYNCDERGNAFVEPYCHSLDDKHKELLVIQEYNAFKENNRLIDFDDIIKLGVEFLENNQNICDHLSKLIGNIYLDESQDTSLIQLKALSYITRYNRVSVFIVGDNDQAIYQDLGVSIKDKDIIKSELQLSELKHETLSGCYRSSELLVKYYKKYSASRNDVTSLREFEGKSPIIKDISQDELPQRVFNLINQYQAKYNSVSGIAIIGPDKYYLMALINALYDLSENFVYDFQSTNPLYCARNTVFYELISLVVLDVNVINYQRRSSLARKIVDSVPELSHLTPLQLKRDLKEFQSVKNNFILWLRELYDFLEMKYQKSIKLETDYKICNAAASVAKIRAGMGAISKMINKDKNVVSVSTIHGSKGEEYDYVISIGYHDQVVPHKSSFEKGNEYARDIANRLMYVAFSRAKNYMNIFIDDRRKVSPFFIREPD